MRIKCLYVFIISDSYISHHFKNSGDATHMVKIRLKRLGYKKNPFYRIVVIDSASKREGAPIQELFLSNFISLVLGL